MNLDTEFVIFHVCLWLMLGSIASGVVFAHDNLKVWRSLTVCFSIFCFCLYAPLGWILIWNLVYPLFGEEDACGGIGALLALALTPCVFVGLCVAVYTLIRRLKEDDTPSSASEQARPQSQNGGKEKQQGRIDKRI